MPEFIARLANRGAMLLAALVVALVFAFVYERDLFGALQYVAAFACYLAFMVATIPLPSLLRTRRYGGASWLALAFALAYAGNGILVGRGQSVALLALGGGVVGLLVGLAAARRPTPQLQGRG